MTERPGVIEAADEPGRQALAIVSWPMANHQQSSMGG
jgi:hypothetical protein